VAASRGALCEACLADLPEQVPAEEVLGANGEAPRLPGPDAAGVSAYTLWRYAEPADRVVLGFKYGGHAGVARLWAARMAPRLPAVDAVIPMPMHRLRLAERGENPAEVMAKSLTAHLPGRPPLIRGCKTRMTARQQGLDREGRLANVADAYRVDAGLSGMHVLLVDDVLTTGASLLALAAAARAAGAAKVTAVAMARATA